MRRSTGMAAFGAVLGSTLLAGQAQARWPDEYRGQEENDSIPWVNEGTDRYYTQGLRLEALWHGQKREARFLPGVSHAAWCSILCGKGARTAEVDAGLAIGQSMYTPERIEIERRQPYDLPWGGYLHASRIARVSYAVPALRAQRQDRIEVTLGIVGPASLAKQTQIFWHAKVVTAPHPAGWDNQLKNEPVVQLRYETALRWPPREGGKADIIPRVRGNVGNGLVSLEAEVTARIGWNLLGFGAGTNPAAPPPPAADGGSEREARSARKVLRSGNVFVRAGLDAVAHNIFLDGNTFVRNDIRIHRKPLVPERAVGIEFNLISRLWLTAQRVRRGSEFKTWRGHHAPDQEFSAVTLAWIKRK